MTIAIRSERAGDAATITRVVQRAYADVPHSDHREHRMVEVLRQTDAFALSLLAEADGEPVGHILLTVARIVRDGSAVATLALAPLSVDPAFQRQGVGTRLVEASHRRAAALGFGSVVLVGMPAYYARFGYRPLSRTAITSPFAALSARCMILPLRPGALDGVEGRIVYEPGWLDH